MTASDQDIIRRYEALAADRTAWEEQWQDSSDYILPRRGQMQGQAQSGATLGQPGRRTGEKMIDGNAPQACEVFAGGLEALLNSNTQHWFRLEAEDKRIDRRPAVRRWLEDATEKLHGIFQDPATGFSTQANEAYLDIGAFGTAVMYVTSLPQRDRPALFQTRNLGECHLEENDLGQIDTNLRLYRLTARQAVAAFSRPGDRLPEKIVQAAAKPAIERFRILHAVFPRRQIAGNPAFARNKPWASIYISLDAKQRIREGGFEEFPYLTPRWSKLSGETYGRGPGTNVMASIKLINAQKKTVQESGALKVRPPLQAPDDGFLDKLSMKLGAVNYYRRMAGRAGDKIEPIDVGGDTGLGVDLMGLEKQIIDNAFLRHVMSIPELDRMTATEIIERRDLGLLQVAPMLSRPEQEMSLPAIERTFRIALRAGLLMPPPEELLRARLRTTFVTPIAIAQRMAAVVRPTVTVLDTVERLAVSDPGVRLAVDGEATLRRVHEASGAPADMLRSPEAVAELRRQASADQQAERDTALTGAEASSAKDLAQAAKAVRDAA